MWFPLMMVLLFLFRQVVVFLLLGFQSELFVVVLVLVVLVGFQLAVGQSKESLDLLFLSVFGFGLGEYHQPYINSVSKWDKEIFCLLLLFFFLLLAAPPPPPR